VCSYLIMWSQPGVLLLVVRPHLAVCYFGCCVIKFSGCCVITFSGCCMITFCGCCMITFSRCCMITFSGVFFTCCSCCMMCFLVFSVASYHSSSLWFVHVIALLSQSDRWLTVWSQCVILSLISSFDLCVITIVYYACMLFNECYT